MKKLTGPKIWEIKTKIRRMVNYKLNMEEEGVNNLRKIIGRHINYMTAIGWVQQIKAEEKLRRLRKRIIK